MISDQEKARQELSLARTALDEGFTDGVNEPLLSPEKAREYAIDRIDDAMRLLSPEKKYGLIVALDGEFTTRAFEAPEEGPGAIREAIALKERQPQSVVTIVIDQF